MIIHGLKTAARRASVPRLSWNPLGSDAWLYLQDLSNN